MDTRMDHRHRVQACAPGRLPSSAARRSVLIYHEQAYVCRRTERSKLVNAAELSFAARNNADLQYCNASMGISVVFVGI